MIFPTINYHIFALPKHGNRRRISFFVVWAPEPMPSWNGVDWMTFWQLVGVGDDANSVGKFLTEKLQERLSPDAYEFKSLNYDFWLPDGSDLGRFIELEIEMDHPDRAGGVLLDLQLALLDIMWVGGHKVDAALIAPSGIELERRWEFFEHYLHILAITDEELARRWQLEGPRLTPKNLLDPAGA